MNTLKGTISRSKQKSPPLRPPLPRLEISGPVPIKPITLNQKTTPIKRQISKPSRPPPPATASGNNDNGDDRPVRPQRPPRPKDRESVAQWWREIEFEKGSGFDVDGGVLEWFHGMSLF